MMRLEGCVLTHEGKIRDKNEDNYSLFGSYKKDTSERRAEESATICGNEAVAAVFDGMGGKDAGEVASMIAAGTLAPCGREEAGVMAVRQILLANERVCAEIERCKRRMGATAAALYFAEGTVTVANIGDSRAYLFRNGVLMQLTVDHSEGQRMIDAGTVTEKEARMLNAWHTLTQHIGIFPEEFVIEPRVTVPFLLQRDDLFLLCSDGLCDMLYNEQIETFLRERWFETTELKAKGLRDAALEAGGADNVTVLLVKVLDAG